MAYTISKDCIGCRACTRICPTGAISGTKKAIHRIEAEICIECGACGRVCPSQVVLDHLGLALERITKKRRQRPWFDLNKCMSCGICLDTCPSSAISQRLRQKGNPHLLPFLKDASLCISCSFCALDCPADAIEMMAAQDAEPVKSVKAD